MTFASSFHQIKFVDYAYLGRRYEPELPRSLSERLCWMGHEVITAVAGQAPLAAIEARAIDLAFLDVTMPGMSGMDAVKRIRLRRPGDVASCYADPNRAFKLLGWRSERGLVEMCADAWRWQSNNPSGYQA